MFIAAKVASDLGFFLFAVPVETLAARPRPRTRNLVARLAGFAEFWSRGWIT